MGEETTPAEQNRLIIEHAELVAPIAAGFRGRKGIPFSELIAEGMLGLVGAAKMWRRKAQFSTYATHKIHSAIYKFVERWEPMEAADIADAGRDPEDAFFEWDIWNFAAPYECWTSLAATPEELVNGYQQVSAKRAALRNAMLSLSKQDRKIVYARFMARPNRGLETIARDNEISYRRVVYILSRALKELCSVVQSIEGKSILPSAASKRSHKAA